MRLPARYLWTGWFLWLACLVLPRPALALYEPEKVGAASRRWAINVSSQGYYDDNINTTAKDQLGGFTSGATIGLRAEIPAEQTFFRMNSEYGVNYAPGRTSGEIDQTVVFSGLLSHTFTPRLVADLNATARYALEPAVSDIISGRSTQLQQSGNYFENNTAASISYNLSRRWTMTARGSWDLWRYDSSLNASNNDRSIYEGSADLIYSLAPRTFAGVGYRYSVQDYTYPGTNDARNAALQNVYLTFSHVFNPRLSANVNAGYESDSFGDGSQSTSPSGSLGLNYNYSRDAVVSLGFRYGFSATQNGQFGGSQTATFFCSANYRFTQKLFVTVNGLYANEQFLNPVPGAFIPGSPIPSSQDSYQIGLSLRYEFNRWVSTSLNYNYEEVVSQIAGNSFTRNRIGLGMNLSY